MFQPTGSGHPKLSRVIYSTIVWIVVFSVGLILGSSLAWPLGASVEVQVLVGLLSGYFLVFAVNRWVRRMKG